ncbi:MAG: hypothetical protein AAB817_00285, partial [Patescibacteria group bacterium]
MKILVGLAAGLLLVVTGLAVYERQVVGPGAVTTAPTAEGTPQTEVFARYFTAVTLTDTTVASQYSLRLKWTKIKPTPAGTVLVRTVDKARSIFIAESAPLDIQGYSGINIKNPGLPGDYELWLYVVDQGNESL